MSKEALDEFRTKHKVTIQSEFVPWSKSRNKDDRNKTLNWRVTLLVDEKPILITDYTAGIGLCPAYQASEKVLGGHDCLTRTEAINHEVETGKTIFAGPSKDRPVGDFMHTYYLRTKSPIDPEINDFLFSMSMDADVLDYGSFEDWADSVGYDTDSRKAESLYSVCIQIALKLRLGLGEQGMADLKKASED